MPATLLHGRVADMTDFQKMQEFFADMGVSFEVDHGLPGDRPDLIRADARWISVTQAHFKFNLAGVFLGVEPDEHGSFEPREDPVSDGYGGDS